MSIDGPKRFYYGDDPGFQYTKEEWQRFPDIGQLIDPGWTPRPERLLLQNPTREVLLGTGKQPTFDRWPADVLRDWRHKGWLILDIGCGRHVHESGIISSPVGFVPGAYGIDPILAHFSGLEGRTVAGFAEDMPFYDSLFDLTLSMRSVGWYAGSAIDPYFALEEMIRVTKPGGLVNITLGAGGGFTVSEATFEENRERILVALESILSTGLGDKIARVRDFSEAPEPQINIRLK